MESKIVVADPPWVEPAVWAGFPVIGAAAAWGLKAVAEWLGTWALLWGPLRGPFRLLSRIDEPYGTIGALVVGAVAGLVIAHLAAKDSLTVTVSDTEVVLDRGGTERAIDGASIAGAFVDGKHLVLLGADTRELAREKSELPAARLRAAFEHTGYRWHDGDPYNDEFRRWDDTLRLSADADALLAARAEALSSCDAEEAARLRGELTELGLVVRDERKRQFWRYTRPVG